MDKNFRICGISIDPGLSWQYFWCRQRAIWAISGSRPPLRSRRRSVSCDLVNVNKVNCGISIDRKGCLVISIKVFDVGNMLSLRNMMAREHGNCRYRQPRNNSCDRVDVNRRKSGVVSHGACHHRLHFAENPWKIHRFARSFRRLFCVAASRILHFAFYQHSPTDGPAKRTSSWHLQP